MKRHTLTDAAGWLSLSAGKRVEPATLQALVDRNLLPASIDDDGTLTILWSDLMGVARGPEKFRKLLAIQSEISAAE